MTNQPLNSKATYCVVYRMGGTANFKWVRTLAMSKDEAERVKLETMRMGYRAMVANYAQSMAVGLPETYE